MTMWRVAMALGRRPDLWPTAVRLAGRMTPSGWWRRSPFLPIPPRDYLEFRLVTQYGSGGERIDAADVLNYVAWCKRQ